jgi:hypothetical protein
MDLDDDFNLLDILDDIENEEYEDEQLALSAVAALLALGANEHREARNATRCGRRLYLTRADLLPYPRRDTPWQQVLHAANDRAFITLMGFDVKTFYSILDSGFRTCWDNFTIPRSDVSHHGLPRLGRRSLDAEGALGLALHYLSSTMRETTLAQVFALTPSTVTRYIQFSLQVLLRVLRKMPAARIRWPQGDEFHELSDLITARHPRLTGAFGFVDGLNLPVGVVADADLANAYYNGWLKANVASSVFVFSPKG